MGWEVDGSNSSHLPVPSMFPWKDDTNRALTLFLISKVNRHSYCSASVGMSYKDNLRGI